MIPSAYYQTVYLVFVMLLSLLTLYKYGSFTQSRLDDAETQRFDGTIVIVLLLVVYTGLRNPYARVFGDTAGYTLFYYRNFGDPYVWNRDFISVVRRVHF